MGIFLIGDIHICLVGHKNICCHGNTYRFVLLNNNLSLRAFLIYEPMCICISALPQKKNYIWMTSLAESQEVLRDGEDIPPPHMHVRCHIQSTVYFSWSFELTSSNRVELSRASRPCRLPSDYSSSNPFQSCSSHFICPSSQTPLIPLISSIERPIANKRGFSSSATPLRSQQSPLCFHQIIPSHLLPHFTLHSFFSISAPLFLIHSLLKHAFPTYMTLTQSPSPLPLLLLFNITPALACLIFLWIPGGETAVVVI